MAFGSNLFNFALNRVFGGKDMRDAQDREDSLRTQDRNYFVSDRNRSEKRADSFLQRLVSDANAAGVSPLAALGGGQMNGPVTSFNSSSYPSYSDRSGVGQVMESSVDSAQARLLNAQADLVDMQVDEAVAARLKRNLTNENLSDPHEITPQKHTPVLDHAVFGKPIKSDPTVADAESHTTRSGESELYEMLLNVVINAKDYLYNQSGLTWRQRMKAKAFDQKMRRDNSSRYLKRTGKQHFRFD